MRGAGYKPNRIMFLGAAKRAEGHASASGHKIDGPVIDQVAAFSDTDPASIFLTSGSAGKGKGAPGPMPS